MGNAYLKVAGSSLLNYYRSADDVEKSIVSHSVTAGALALVPLPGYSEAACLLVQMGMYKRIHDITGIPIFSDQIAKNIGKFILSQVAGLFGGLVAVFGVFAVAKFVPGLGFIAGIGEAPVVGVMNYVCGKVYYTMLGELLRTGDISKLDSQNIKETLKRMQCFQKADLEKFKAEGKSAMKSVNYKDGKTTAQEIAREVKSSYPDQFQQTDGFSKSVEVSNSNLNIVPFNLDDDD